MAIPFKPIGAGQVAAKNVFKIAFSEALSAIPELHAWDTFECDTATNRIFAGTTGNGDLPMIGAIGLDAAPSAAWWPAAAVAGAAVNVASRLKGLDGYCLLAASAPAALGEVFFNLDFSFPSDMQPADSYGYVLTTTYRYTGAVPSIVWSANDGGSEATPIWTTLTSQPKGTDGAATVIRVSDAGGDGAGDIFSIPGSGEAAPAEIWLTTAA